GMVYGRQFQNGILNRLVSEGTLSGAGRLDIVWLGAVEKGVGTEISYRMLDGSNRTSFVPMSSATTVLNDVAGDIKYRTLFLPEATAIDTFYTEWENYEPLREERLDGPLFQRWNPVGIPYTQYSPAFSIETLWDDDPTNRY